MALIARLRLFQASPLFNGGAAARKCFGTWKRKSDGAYYVNQEYDPRRWAVAAAAAKQLTKMGYELHTVEADAQNPTLSNWKRKFCLCFLRQPRERATGKQGHTIIIVSFL